MTTSLTRYFRWGIPDFTTAPWHSDWDALVRAIDRTLYEAMIAAGMTEWTNSTNYEAGMIVQDPDDGSVWVCAVDHVSAAAPTTMAQDRAANPTYWASLTPAQELADLVAQAQIAANQAVGSGAMATTVSQQATLLLNRVAALVNSISSQVGALAYEAGRHSREAYTSAQRSDAQVSAAGGFAAMAAMDSRRAVAASAALTDDQIRLKAAVFN